MSGCACGVGPIRRFLGTASNEYHTKDECRYQKWVSVRREEPKPEPVVPAESKSYRRRGTVEAVLLSHDTIEAVAEWAKAKGFDVSFYKSEHSEKWFYINIKSLLKDNVAHAFSKGIQRTETGWEYVEAKPYWIVANDRGAVYQMTPELFKQTYEEVQ